MSKKMQVPKWVQCAAMCNQILHHSQTCPRRSNFPNGSRVQPTTRLQTLISAWYKHCKRLPIIMKKYATNSHCKWQYVIKEKSHPMCPSSGINYSWRTFVTTNISNLILPSAHIQSWWPTNYPKVSSSIESPPRLKDPFETRYQLDSLSNMKNKKENPNFL